MCQRAKVQNASSFSGLLCHALLLVALVGFVLVPCSESACPPGFNAMTGIDADLCVVDAPYGRSAFPGAVAKSLRSRMFLRSETTPATNLSTVIFVHGGGFVEGSYVLVDPYSKWAARAGFLGISVEYYLASSVEARNQVGGFSYMMEAMRNVQTLVRVLKQSSLPINPDRIYVAGHSAGAVTTYAVAIRSDEAGSMSELVARQETNPLVPSTTASSTIAGAFVVGGAACGYPGWRDGVLVQGTFTFKNCSSNISPAGDARIVMLSGLWDTVVPASQSDEACQAANDRAAGSCTHYIYGRYNFNFWGYIIFEQWWGNEVWRQSPTSTHSDQSVGNCDFQIPPGFFASDVPGGDHSLLDPNKCPARAGIDMNGKESPGFARGDSNPQRYSRTIAYTIKNVIDNNLL
jgi:acetyl esterase/lipase